MYYLIGVHNSPKTIKYDCRKCPKQVRTLMTAECGTLVTMVTMVTMCYATNALGNIIPPIFIYISNGSFRA